MLEQVAPLLHFHRSTPPCPEFALAAVHVFHIQESCCYNIALIVKEVCEIDTLTTETTCSKAMLASAQREHVTTSDKG
jgi:hypothetical protein